MKAFFLAIIVAFFALISVPVNAGGKCNGSDPCSACTNCSRCKHCKSGTCGACKPTPPPKVKKTKEEKQKVDSLKQSSTKSVLK